MKDLFVTIIIYCIALVCSLLHANIYRKELIVHKIRDNFLISLRLVFPFLLFSFIFQSFGISALYGYSITTIIFLLLFASMIGFPSFLCFAILIVFYQWTFWFPERKCLILHPKLTDIDNDNDLACLVGQTGKTVTDLKLSGKVLIDNKEYRARSEDGFLNSNQLVKVVSTDAFGLVVREIAEFLEGEL